MLYSALILIFYELETALCELMWLWFLKISNRKQNERLTKSISHCCVKLQECLRTPLRSFSQTRRLCLQFNLTPINQTFTHFFIVSNNYWFWSLSWRMSIRDSCSENCCRNTIISSSSSSPCKNPCTSWTVFPILWSVIRSWEKL